MAAASPALSSNSADSNRTATTSVNAVVVAGTTGANTITSTMTVNNLSTNTSKNLRGLNKPKCIKCGNVARSRCPYQACKNCCAKAQNPCHIHVLKGGSSLPEKTPSSNASLVDQHSNETSSAGNSTHRFTSLRQLSTKFVQFSNLQTPIRSRKPPTRKEAAQINEWRFSKLKEYKERNIEVENEAFDRYLHNISLLEEVFAVNSKLEEPTKHESLVSNPNANPVEEKSETMISEMKLKLRADPERIENLRDRMQFIVNNGLRKLKRLEIPSGDEEVDLVKRPKKARYLELCDLNKKLSNARTEEDLESCLLLKAQLFSRPKKTCDESENIELSKQQGAKNDTYSKQKSERSPSKWFTTTTIDQEAVNRMDARFCSLQEIEHL